jgi:uncharacterized protein with FMN-binding domain
MRRITLWLFSTVAAVVLLFSYRTSTGSGVSSAVAAVAPAATPSAGDAAPSSAAAPAPSSAGAAPSSAGAAASPSASASAAGSGQAPKTYTGSTAGTRWGDVQVTITVADGRITDVQVPVYPNGNGRDQEINAFALPQLTQETLQAQSADIQTVSGATVTSDGYLQSLQSALDAAGL